MAANHAQTQSPHVLFHRRQSRAETTPLKDFICYPPFPKTQNKSFASTWWHSFPLHTEGRVRLFETPRVHTIISELMMVSPVPHWNQWEPKRRPHRLPAPPSDQPIFVTAHRRNTQWTGPQTQGGESISHQSCFIANGLPIPDSYISVLN